MPKLNLSVFLHELVMEGLHISATRDRLAFRPSIAHIQRRYCILPPHRLLCGCGCGARAMVLRESLDRIFLFFRSTVSWDSRIGSSAPHSFLTRSAMACNPDVLRQVPLFALLDEEEIAVLAAQVDLKTFSTRQRIYKTGDPGGRAYVMISGAVRVTTVDEDHQEVVIHEPAAGEFFGFASMLERMPHQTDAIALDDSVCLEID